MPAFIVVEIDVQDAGWLKAYNRTVPGIIASHGGRYIARAAIPEVVESVNPVPQFFAMVEFPTVEAARAMMADPAYQPFAEARRAGSRSNIYIIPGVEGA